MSTIISRPDKPEHRMELVNHSGVVSAWIGNEQIAQSSNLLVVKEKLSREFSPVVYFPIRDVKQGALISIEKTSRCTLKGTASYFDIKTGSKEHHAAAWGYDDVLDFDPNLKKLKGHVAFDPVIVTIKKGA